MIKIENIDTYGWEAAIRGMRNPMNSWDKSDSYENYTTSFEDGFEVRSPYYRVGAADVALMKSLVKAGTDHRKFLRMINVTMDITAPLYWWKEFDTYKVGTVRNSCSTMHKIAAKKFELDDFSHEHLFDDEENMAIFKSSLCRTIADLNTARELYFKTKDRPMKSEQSRQELMKKYWYQMIQLLPSSYNQRATVQLNYEVLRNMYHARKDHKLDEWREFCKILQELPYSDLITSI